MQTFDIIRVSNKTKGESVVIAMVITRKKLRPRCDKERVATFNGFVLMFCLVIISLRLNVSKSSYK